MLKQRVLWCFMIAACFIQSESLDHQTDNELCKAIAKSNGDFSCKPIDQCTTFIQAAQQQRIYPKICRFHGRTPIVCCPTSQDIVDQNKFTEKCREYYSLTTNGGGSIDPARSCNPRRATENKVLTIVGGTVAEENEFPHMVILGFGKTIEDVEWSCGGSLISDLYILSAAHCSEIGNKGQIKWALLGDNNLGSGGGNADPQTREIIQRILHPDFYPPSVYNDIGLYRMDTPVQFNQFIMPICLDIEKEVIAKEAIAIGWGRTDSAGPTSNVLMKVSLNLVNQNECNHSYSASILEKKLAFGINPKSQICAGEMEGGKDTCQGDSGGPLQIVHAEFECMYTQIGITSFGKLCGQPNAPGVYTRVSNYVSWIDSVVWPTTMSTP